MTWNHLQTYASKRWIDRNVIGRSMSTRKYMFKWEGSMDGCSVSILCGLRIIICKSQNDTRNADERYKIVFGQTKLQTKVFSKYAMWITWKISSKKTMELYRSCHEEKEKDTSPRLPDIGLENVEGNVASQKQLEGEHQRQNCRAGIQPGAPFGWWSWTETNRNPSILLSYMPSGVMGSE